VVGERVAFMAMRESTRSPLRSRDVQSALARLREAPVIA
jgi:hypothetical protein